MHFSKLILFFFIAVIDGVDTSAMSREQLEKFAHNLRNEMEREREERNFFQLERDKLRTFWEITRNQLGKYWYTTNLLISHQNSLEFIENNFYIKISNVLTKSKAKS